MGGSTHLFIISTKIYRRTKRHIFRLQHDRARKALGHFFCIFSRRTDKYNVTFFASANFCKKTGSYKIDLTCRLRVQRKLIILRVDSRNLNNFDQSSSFSISYHLKTNGREKSFRLEP